MSNFIPNNWNRTCAVLWEKGDRDGALQLLVKELNASDKAEPKAVLQQFAYYTFHIGDFAASARAMQRVVELYGEDTETLLNLAVLKNRGRDYAGAITYLEKAAALGLDTGPLHDGLCAAYSALKRYDKAAVHGTRALECKDRDTGRERPQLSIPENPPVKNVISFCIWGNKARYLKGLLRNVLLAPDIYPDWNVRVYHDKTVPEDYLSLIKDLGAQLIEKSAENPHAEKLMWRFLVADDTNVGRFLVRDCDSVINIREQHAVMEWIASDKAFHIIRDWWTHTDLMLAGLWGGYAGLLPKMDTLIAEYAPNIATANMDQLFLKDRIWPLVANNGLIHDRFFKMAESHPMPNVSLSGVSSHVGQDEHAANRTLQNRILKPYIDLLPCLRD